MRPRPATSRSPNSRSWAAGTSTCRLAGSGPKATTSSAATSPCSSEPSPTGSPDQLDVVKIRFPNGQPAAGRSRRRPAALRVHRRPSGGLPAPGLRRTHPSVGVPGQRMPGRQHPRCRGHRHRSPGRLRLPPTICRVNHALVFQAISLSIGFFTVNRCRPSCVRRRANGTLIFDIPYDQPAGGVRLIVLRERLRQHNPCCAGAAVNSRRSPTRYLTSTPS